MADVKKIEMSGKLSDEQLEDVVGGVKPEAIYNAIQKVIAVGASSAESIQKLVDSHEYRRMDNAAREKALGQLLANNPVFCAAIVAAIPLGLGVPTLGVLQIQYRTSGVGQATREYIERAIACQ